MNESEIFQTPIQHKTMIRKPKALVFNAMTTAQGLNSWFTANSEIDRKVGGQLILRWKDWGPDKKTHEVFCQIIEFDEPNRFVFKWWPDHYTVVQIDFIDANKGTLVKVTENGYANTADGHRRSLECAVGWGEALTLLKFHVEYGIHY